MKIKLRCFSSLASEDSCSYTEDTTYNLDEGLTVGDLVQSAQIARSDVKIAFVNNRSVDFDTVLADGDRLGLAPAVGGM